jgi:hypothetical protein
MAGTLHRLPEISAVPVLNTGITLIMVISIRHQIFLFGPFTNGFAYNVILPVTLLSFDAKISNGNGFVSWKVNDDKDLDHFELQHSQAGDKFMTIGAIKSNAGTLKYDFIHRNLDGGSHYYRLLVKENSGKEFYSKTVLLKVPVSTYQDCRSKSESITK